MIKSLQCHFWATVCKTVRPMPSDRCPVCNIGVLSPNSWMDQDQPCYAGTPRPWPHFVRWGPSPEFLAHICCGQMAGWIKMPLGMEAGDFVLDGDPAPLPERGQSPSPIFGPCLL